MPDQWRTSVGAASGTAVADRIELCRSVLDRTGTPQHLAYFSRGFEEFSLTLDDGTTSKVSSDVGRARLSATGRQAIFSMSNLDIRLADFDTGRLIRVVVQSEHGTLFGSFIRPREYLFGAVFETRSPELLLTDHPLSEMADRAISGLATDLREEIGLLGLNPGGWVGDPPLAPDPVNGSAETIGDRGPAVVARCAALLRPEEIVYLAHFRRGSPIFRTDLFGHPGVDAFVHDPVALRAGYDALTSEFDVLRGDFAQTTRQVVKGKIVRIVLDVEIGAIFWYRLASDEYLVGVTLNQGRVSEADAGLARLAADWPGEMQS